MDTKLKMSQQRAFLAKTANGILGCIRQSMITPLYSALVRHNWSARPVLGSPGQERHGHTGPVKDHKDDEETGASLIQGKPEKARTV